MAGLDWWWKSRPPPRFDSRTTQPVASRYTGCWCGLYWWCCYLANRTSTVVFVYLNLFMCWYLYLGVTNLAGHLLNKSCFLSLPYVVPTSRHVRNNHWNVLTVSFQTSVAYIKKVPHREQPSDTTLLPVHKVATAVETKWKYCNYNSRMSLQFSFLRYSLSVNWILIS